jgi:hypothetical protein
VGERRGNDREKANRPDAAPHIDTNAPTCRKLLAAS